MEKNLQSRKWNVTVGRRTSRRRTSRRKSDDGRTSRTDLISSRSDLFSFLLHPRYLFAWTTFRTERIPRVLPDHLDPGSHYCPKFQACPVPSSILEPGRPHYLLFEQNQQLHGAYQSADKLKLWSLDIFELLLLFHSYTVYTVSRPV